MRRILFLAPLLAAVTIGVFSLLAAGRASVVQAQPPPVTITKTDSPDPVLPGSNITYTITIANVGTFSQDPTTVSDVVPAGTTFVSFSQLAGPPFTLTSPAVGSSGT